MWNSTLPEKCSLADKLFWQILEKFARVLLTYASKMTYGIAKANFKYVHLQSYLYNSVRKVDQSAAAAFLPLGVRHFEDSFPLFLTFPTSIENIENMKI